MKPLPRQLILPFVLLSAISTTRSLAQTPAPAIHTPFLLPLADNSQASAVLLPTANAQAYLVYATHTGTLGFYLLVPTTNPTPPPNPQPTTTIALILIGDRTTPTLDPTIAAYLSQHGDTTEAYSVATVADPHPPDTALYWIGLSAGKSYPYAFIVQPPNTILWEGNLPTKAADTIALLNQIAKRSTRTKPCPSGTCPLLPQNPPWPTLNLAY